MNKWLSVTILFTLIVFKSVNAQERKYSFDFQEQSLESILSTLEKTSNYYFLYNHEDVVEYKTISFFIEDLTIQQILEICLQYTNLVYEIDEQLIILKKQIEPDLSIHRITNDTISGFVTDAETREPLVGANVYLKGTNLGTVTNNLGYYSLIYPDTVQKLMYSFIGYIVEEHRIQDIKRLDVDLEIALSGIAEILATGYRMLPKNRATGSFSSITSKDLEQVISPNLLDKIEGMLSGLEVRNGRIVIRGQNTFNTEEEQLEYSSTGVNDPRGIRLLDGSEIYYRGNPSAPLIVLDGFPYEGNLNDIDPNDIESINILKDAASASIWGVRASNGVIVITREKAKKDGRVNIRFDAYTQISDQPNVADFNFAPAYVALDVEKYALDSLGRSWDLATSLNGSTALETIYYKRDVSKEITWPQAERMIAELRNKSNYGQAQDLFYQRRFTQNYNFQLSHTTGKLENILSFSYVSNKHAEIGNIDNKLNMSLRTIYNLNNWLQLNFNYSSLFKNRSTNGMVSSFSSGQLRPYELIQDENDGFLPMFFKNNVPNHTRKEYEELGYLPWHWNPIEEQYNNDISTNKRLDILQVAGNLKLPFGLQYQTQFQYQYGRSDKELFYNTSSYITRNLINRYTQYELVADIPVLKHNFPVGGGTRQLTHSTTSNFSFRNQLNFDRTFDERHWFSASVGTDLIIADTHFNTETNFGYNTISGNNGNRNINLRDLTVEGKTESIKYTFNNQLYPLTAYASSVGFRKNRDFSTWGMLGYIFDERYNLSLSGRTDRSNLLASAEKNFLWSSGVSWTASNEAFFTKWKNIVEYARLRTTFGYTGNVDRSAIPFLRGRPGIDTNTGTEYLIVNEPSNPDLKPERTRNINIGIDISLPNNFLSFSADYYNNLSTNLIVYQKTDPTNKGWMQGAVNNGSILNKGVDLKIDLYPLKTAKFRWKTTLNLGLNKNIVKDYAIDATPVYYNGLITGSLQSPGFALNPIFSYDYAGLDNQGNPQIRIDNKVIQTIVKDQDGNLQYGYHLVDIDDLVYGGSRTPKYFGGFFSTFIYKSFSLMFNLNFKLGHYMRMPVVELRGDFVDRFTPHKDIIDRWQKTGDELATNIPRIYGATSSGDPQYETFWPLFNHGDWYRYASTGVEKADFVRLRYINFGYQVPQHLVRKIKMKSLRLSIQIDNIGYWAANSKNYDPEFVNVPNPRIYTLGLYSIF